METLLQVLKEHNVIFDYKIDGNDIFIYPNVSAENIIIEFNISEDDIE